MRKAFILVVSGLGAAMPLIATAAQQPQPAAQAGRLESRAIVAEVRRIISERYVLPERRPALDAVLAQGLALGRYDVADPAILAQRINADLERVGRDRHLTFRFDPAEAATRSAPRAGGAPDMSAFERRVRSANHGVSELRVLPGNVRYMAHDGALWIGPESAAALENAMRFLIGGEAIIIDIRGHGGGSPDPSQYLLSHFMPADRPLYTFYMNGETERVSTLPAVPAGRVLGKPLYVLTSRTTASAAEEFAGNVAGYRLGELVGETTAGAGYMNAVMPIDGRFVLSVSTGRVVLASTGRDWEAVGISPTIPVASGQALDTAHVHALRRIVAQAPAQERPRLEALADGIAARLQPRPAALPLAAYAGRYGERTVIAQEGRLYFQRGTGSRTPLIPLGGNRFALDSDPGQHVAFVVAGNRAAAFAIERPGSPVLGPYERTQ